MANTGGVSQMQAECLYEHQDIDYALRFVPSRRGPGTFRDGDSADSENEFVPFAFLEVQGSQSLVSLLPREQPAPV